MVEIVCKIFKPVQSGGQIVIRVGRVVSGLAYKQTFYVVMHRMTITTSIVMHNMSISHRGDTETLNTRFSLDNAVVQGPGSRAQVAS